MQRLQLQLHISDSNIVSQNYEIVSMTSSNKTLELTLFPTAQPVPDPEAFLVVLNLVRTKLRTGNLKAQQNAGRPHQQEEAFPHFHHSLDLPICSHLSLSFSHLCLTFRLMISILLFHYFTALYRFFCSSSRPPAAVGQ